MFTILQKCRKPAIRNILKIDIKPRQSFKAPLSKIYHLINFWKNDNLDSIPKIEGFKSRLNFALSCIIASIWATDNLAGIVISVKILGLKFRSYIAGCHHRAFEGP